MSKSYSYSQLQSAYRCNKLYKYLYIDKLDSGAKPNDALVFGSSMHFALEEFLLHNANPVESFRIYWDSEASKIEFGRFKRKELEVMAEILLDRFRRLHAKKIEVNQMEQRLYGTVSKEPGAIRLEGTPDVLGSFDGTPSVIDFKTSSYRYDKEKAYLNEQMYLYAHLAKQNGFEALQVVYIVFIKGKEPSIQTIKRTITPEHMSKVLANIKNQCDTLEVVEKNGLWSANTNSCIQSGRKCDFYNKCWEGYENE